MEQTGHQLVIKGYRGVEGAEPSYWKPRGKLK
jgi:hypothetical protein